MVSQSSAFAMWPRVKMRLTPLLVPFEGNHNADVAHGENESDTRTSIEVHPWSDAISRSFRTLTKAVSVLWWALKPDWRVSSILFWCKKEVSCLATIFFKYF